MTETKRKKTRHHLLILAYVNEHKDAYFSAYDVFKYFNMHDISVSIATIYRQLDKMIEDGILHKYRDLETNAALYFFVDKESKHACDAHMKCMECGKIYPLQCTITKEFAGHIENEHHFFIDMDETILYGICEECNH